VETLVEQDPKRSTGVHAASRFASRGADHRRTGQDGQPLTNNTHLTLRIMYAATTVLRDSGTLQTPIILAPLQ
jgi:hypothetical protein